MHLLKSVCLPAVLLAWGSLPSLTDAKCRKHGLKFSELRGGRENHTVDDAIRDFCEIHEVFEGWGHVTRECYNFPETGPGGNHLAIEVRWFNPQDRPMPNGIEGCIKTFRKEARNCQHGSHHAADGPFYRYCDIVINPSHGRCPLGEDRVWPLNPGGDWGLPEIEQPSTNVLPKGSKPPSGMERAIVRRQGGPGVVAPLYPFDEDVDGYMDWYAPGPPPKPLEPPTALTGGLVRRVKMT